MHNLAMDSVTALYGAILPLSILLTEDDADRQFLTELYTQYKPLLYKVACQFFSGDSSEVDDAVSGAVERLCKKCDTVKSLACNKRASYIVSITRNVCFTRLRELKRQRLHLDFGPNGESLETVASADDVQEMVFCNILASDLLNAFPELSERDRELIRMRHIDQLDYEDIAALCGISEGTVRTALCRAKRKLEQLTGKKQGKSHE